MKINENALKIIGILESRGYEAFVVCGCVRDLFLTMNAIAYNPKTGIIDPYQGQEAIRLKEIKTVGKPEERFKEDALEESCPA
ncbi:hypothetical protein [Desulfosporosinus orientis]|uniref:hypothetical protein n=1 Tax=Desulfosporosinus orientis TaxID=1563 RepID=UPI00030B89BD|nr:hypothetical protein [Desulfosporosinus orientis]